MAATRNPAPPFWRGNIGFLATLGSVAAMALGCAGVFASVSGGMATEKAAYDAAPTCTSPTDLSACRYEAQGRVVGTSTRQGNPTVDVAFDEIDRLATASLDQAYTPQWQKWQVDTPVAAELWRGRLVKVQGLMTLENPDSYPIAGSRTAAYAMGAIAVALAAALAWFLVLYRRELAARTAALAGGVPGLQPQPLTRDITAYLVEDARRLDPQRAVALVGGAVALIATIISILCVANGFPTLILAYVWTACLGLGGLVAWDVAHGVWQSRQDLVSGVFIRASGPFSVRMERMKRGSSAVVAVAGRALPSVVSSSLESVASGAGTVDYLPHSGTLIQITDESGNVLWSRFGRIEVGEPAAVAQSAAR